MKNYFYSPTKTQFVMAGANILTPQNIIINATTEFESSLKC